MVIRGGLSPNYALGLLCLYILGTTLRIFSSSNPSSYLRFVEVGVLPPVLRPHLISTVIRNVFRWINTAMFGIDRVSVLLCSFPWILDESTRINYRCTVNARRQEMEPSNLKRSISLASRLTLQLSPFEGDPPADMANLIYQRRGHYPNMPGLALEQSSESGRRPTKQAT